METKMPISYCDNFTVDNVTCLVLKRSIFTPQRDKDTKSQNIAANTTTSATPSPVIIHTPNGRPISPSDQEVEENEKTPSSMKKKSTP